MFGSSFLTFDIDWAPDFCLDYIGDILVEHNIKATWFVTHDSPGVQRLLKRRDLFDFGLHPNFLPGSTQGRNEREVMTLLKSIVPDAKSMRTHSLVQSSRLLPAMQDEFGIETDLSLLLPGTPNIQPHVICYGNSRRGLLRIPSFWEDGVEMHDPFGSWDFAHERYHVKGLKVFSFHPILVYLNVVDVVKYELMKKESPSNRQKQDVVNRYVNKVEPGAGDLFSAFVSFLRKIQKKTYTMAEVSVAWRKKIGTATVSSRKQKNREN